MFKNRINAARKMFRMEEGRDLSGLKASVVASVAAGIGSAQAAGVDFSTLTGAVDFSTLISAVVAIGANVLLVYVAFKGAKIIIGAVKGM